MVTAVVTHDGACAGTVGPFPCRGPVVGPGRAGRGAPGADARRAGRRLAAAYGRGFRRGARRPRHLPRGGTRATGGLAPCDFADDDHPLRLPWARPSGVRELLGWASEHVDLTGRPVQSKTWNLSGLFRLPTADGPVWLKAIPGFAAAEPAAIAAFAEVDPGLVPAVLASATGRLLLADVPGADCWDASPAGRGGRRASAWPPPRPASARRRPAIPDRRTQVLAAAVVDLLDGPVGAELSTGELRAARSLQPRWEMLADCGLPDTVVHGDFHPGNWRRGDGAPVVLDFADAARGQSGARRAARDRLPAGSRRATAASAWIAAWTAAAPGHVRPRRYKSPGRWGTSPTPCATRSSSTTSSPASASTISAIRPG